MTVRLAQGDIFESGAQCLVNPVNVVGVMGAGLAQQFAARWPALLAGYRQACRNGDCQIGQVYLWYAGNNPTWIANLPTKAHWRDPSRLSYVTDGLANLDGVARQHHIESIAMPALGCGLGGLPFEQVHDAVAARFSQSHIQVLLFPPAGSSPAAAHHLP